jgi:hypothetical protein
MASVPHLPELLSAVPWAARVVSALEDQGAVLCAVRSLESERVWLLETSIPAAVRRRLYPAERMVVLLVADAVGALDLARARHTHHDAGVEPELVVVVDGSPGLEERLARLTPERGVWVPGGSSLEERIAAVLPANNVFDRHSPVRGGRVFGREEEIAEISARVLRGESVGVFGLRKIGKTTLVRAVTDRLESQALVAWIDAQGVRREDIRDLVRQLGHALFERAARAGIEAVRPDGTLEGLEHLLSAMLAQSPLPVTVVIDECDLLFAGDDGAPIPSVSSLLGQLRSLSQTRGRLSVVLIGRTPSATQAPLLEGRPNPFLAWFRVLWLPPLRREAADQMLARLGERVGLEVSPSTLELAWQWTGGHAFLHRQLGSALWRVADAKAPVDTAPLEQAALELFEGADDVEAAVEDILRLLEVHFPDAYDALWAFVREGRGEAMPLRRLGLWPVPEIVARRARWAPKLRRASAR